MEYQDILRMLSVAGLGITVCNLIARFVLNILDK